MDEISPASSPSSCSPACSPPCRSPNPRRQDAQSRGATSTTTTGSTGSSSSTTRMLAQQQSGLAAGGMIRGRPAAANAARERSRVQTLRHAFLELQRTLPSVPPDTKLSKLDVLILATTYIAHLTRTLQEDEGSEEAEGTAKQVEALHSLKGQGYLHPVKKWPMRSRLYVGASGQFLHNSNHPGSENQGPSSSTS
ncbi:hypothetical protein CRUP_014183 [Coryphaenoides rupestris]|nr:hypothetical protein CRUP_014183 [Coryphaenoides rupestris]